MTATCGLTPGSYTPFFATCDGDHVDRGDMGTARSSRTLSARSGNDCKLTPRHSSSQAESSGESEDEADGPPRITPRSNLPLFLVRELLDIEHDSLMSLQNDSIYGAVLVIPQVARTARWTKTMKILTFRCYTFLAFNYLLQFSTAYFIYNELNSLNKFAGRPNLCDFGGMMWQCPNSPNCIGPGGTSYASDSLYDFDAWQTRTYVRDALLSLFPERSEDIAEKVKPGEYGLESYYCRVFCCLIFCIVVLEDLYNVWNLIKLLYLVPSEAQDWVQPNAAAENEKEEDLLIFRIAGMPFHWKIVNVLVVLIPQLSMFKLVASCGINFLMDTSDITDLIVNVTSITFLLQIDELIFTHFASKSTKYIMENINAFSHFKPHEAQHDMYDEVEGGVNRLDLVRMIPWRMVLTLCAFFLFMAEYYHRNCVLTDDGSWVSRTLYRPVTVFYNPLCTIMECDPPETDKVVWEMPNTR